MTKLTKKSSENLQIKKFLKLLSLVVVNLFLLIVFFESSPPTQKPTPQVKTVYTTQNVAELAEILGPDQETRLKAARKLVERVNVTAALEILENSSLPPTGEGHLVVHQIGFYAYQKFGVDSILLCKDYFLYACYHGAIIEAATEAGFPQISKMTDRCKASSVRYFQCVHAAGHAILAIWNYDLPKALTTCDQLYQGQTQFPEVLSSCHNGAFMENLFGVHDWGRDKAAKRDWLKDNDPYFPCNAFAEIYQRGCWLNQAAAIYQMVGGDVVKTRELCEKIGNSQYTVWCMDNLARQIHPQTAGDVAKVFTLCQQVGPFWFENCLVVNAAAYYSVGGREKAIVICKQITTSAEIPCFNSLIGQIVGESLPKEEKVTICTKLGREFEKQCLLQIEI